MSDYEKDITDVYYVLVDLLDVMEDIRKRQKASIEKSQKLMEKYYSE